MNEEKVDRLLLKSLKDAYDNLLAIDPEDTKTGKALKRVIKFYSTPDQYKEWKDSI